MSPKQQRGEITAERLLDAALEAYVAEGLQGFTVKAVRERSGVSLGSLYHHFGSLDGLFTALADRWLGVLLGRMVTALTGDDDARGGIRALTEAYFDFIREHRDAALFLHASDTNRHGMARARELRDAQEARLSPLAQWVAPRVASGELADLPGPLFESLVLGPVVATARRWLSDMGDVDLDEAARVLPDRIWLAVRGPGTTP
ncbi:TetR/AcrR family transcriptional regulator [Streptomyces sp. NPDC052302]|jgi:AcrR family transcriptional regulator|uniref:TetR/AcrR family transcriptional regulator n=1 Tax=Streptomyces sp. NPDC052302 TaxID=3365688 RepID=UPI0037D6EAEB